MKIRTEFPLTAKAIIKQRGAKLLEYSAPDYARGQVRRWRAMPDVTGIIGHSLSELEISLCGNPLIVGSGEEIKRVLALVPKRANLARRAHGGWLKDFLASLLAEVRAGAKSAAEPLFRGMDTLAPGKRDSALGEAPREAGFTKSL